MKNLSKYSWMFVLTLLSPFMAFANEAAAAGGSISNWSIPFAALGLGIAVFGAASGQSKIASAYMEGVARNPSADKVMKTQLILSLVFVETLVIFTLGIVAVIVFK